MYKFAYIQDVKEHVLIALMSVIATLSSETLTPPYP